MLRYRLSPRAKTDIKEISKYHIEKASMKVADSIMDNLNHSLNLICTHPNLGHIEPQLIDFPQCFRTLVNVPNYKIIYWLDEDMIKIATVFDCRQRPEELYLIINTRTDWVCEPPVEYNSHKK